MRIFAISILLGSLAIQVKGEDWPTYGHDNRRSHVTQESLSLPLSESWVYRSATPPQTAWTGPAKWDAFAGNEGLQSMRNFDPVFYVTAVGDQVAFGSSVDHAVHLVSATTGEEQWVAFTDGAVRLPPTWADGRLYFGSDDGHAYCVDSESGREIWKYRPSDEQRLIPSNGKLMSTFPVRTGVLVDGATAYFGCSLFPWEPSFLCSLDVKTGEKYFVEKLSGVTLQGALLASSERLYVPQGRSVPLVFAKSSGSQLGSVAGTGGVYCILTAEDQLIAMPKNQKSKDDVVTVTDPANRESVLSIVGTARMIASGRNAYFHQLGQLKAIDRFVAAKANQKLSALKKAKAPDEEIGKARNEGEAAQLWSSRQPIPSALVLAGRQLYLGGDGQVFAVDSESGEKIWSAEVEGRAYGLAVANGRLFVSTDRGFIYGFSQASR
tara:strand:+ start:592 stop:1902 length:1311 start_codon:yes stop_codon:yes gene_type:complete